VSPPKVDIANNQKGGGAKTSGKLLLSLFCHSCKYIRTASHKANGNTDAVVIQINWICMQTCSGGCTNQLSRENIAKKNRRIFFYLRGLSFSGDVTMASTGSRLNSEGLDGAPCFSRTGEFSSTFGASVS
jgi:hypothetical protein